MRWNNRFMGLKIVIFKSQSNIVESVKYENFDKNTDFLAKTDLFRTYFGKNILILT